MLERPDHRTELGLDQRLIGSFGRLANPVVNLGGLECLQDFKQGRLVQGHRVLCPGGSAVTSQR